MSVNGINVKTYKVEPTKRLNVNDTDAMIMCVVRKAHGKPPAWPMQSKYLTNPGLKGEETKTRQA